MRGGPAFTGASGGMTGAMFTPRDGSGGTAGLPGVSVGRKTRAGTTPGWGAGPDARACSVRNSPVGDPRGAWGGERVPAVGAAGPSRVGVRGGPAAGCSRVGVRGTGGGAGATAPIPGGWPGRGGGVACPGAAPGRGRAVPPVVGLRGAAGLGGPAGGAAPAFGPGGGAGGKGASSFGTPGSGVSRKVPVVSKPASCTSEGSTGASG